MTLHSKMWIINAWTSMLPLKALSIQVWIRYRCLFFLSWLFFNCGFTTKVTCAFLLQENKEELPDLTVKPRKTTVFSTFLIRYRFKRYRCELGIVPLITVPLTQIAWFHFYLFYYDKSRNLIIYVEFWSIQLKSRTV